MKIILGIDRVSLVNPPNDGTVWIGPNEWRIARTGEGEIVLKQNGVCHPDFTDGMDLHEFCEWVNEHEQGVRS